MYRTLHERTDRVLGYAIAGEVDTDQVEQMQQEISAAMERYGSVSLLMRIEDLDGVEPAAAWQDLKMTPEYLRNVDRAALVGGERWHEWVARLSDTVAQVRHFSPQDEGRAWEWLREAS